MRHLALVTLIAACVAGEASPARADAQPLAPTATLNAFTAGSQDNCDISSAFDRELLYVWDSEGQDGSGRGVFARLLASPSEFQVNTYTTGDQTDPAVSHSPDGSFVVVYVSDSPTPGMVGILGQRFRPDGTPLGSEFVVRVSSETISLPDVSHGRDGGLVATWVEGGPFTGEVWGRPFRLDAVPLTPPGRISATCNARVGPRVAHNSISDFVIVWQHADGIVKEIHAVCFDVVGNLICSEFKVNTSSLILPVASVDVSYGPHDDFVVVWDAPYNAQNDADIRGQRFDSSGAPVGGEFVVNTTGGVPHVSPVVTHGPLGDFVVAWRRATQLRARCFSADATPAGADFLVDSGDFPPPAALAFYEDRRFALGWTRSTDIKGRLYEVTQPVAVETGPAPRGLVAFAHPTVFRDRTEIGFEIERPSEVSVRIVDLQGRTVKTLVDGAFGAGAHGASWSGEDDAGRRVSAGVYFYIVISGDQSRTGRVVRVP